MDLKVLHDKSIIFNYLKQNSGIQVYLIGDLDEFFWPKTVWYSLMENNVVKSIALMYVGMNPPTLLSFYGDEYDNTRILLNKIKAILPQKFNAHLSPKLLDIFGKENILKYYGFNYKMLLTQKISFIDDKNIRKLTIEDLSQIEDFYTVSYPQNWFDSRMLQTNKYYGYFIDNQLVGVSGIHVYSEEFKVAALGNIATHPNHRGKGIASKLTSALCYDLQQSVDAIGLNVKSDNEYAIKCYQKIGFEIVGEYDECFLENASL